MLDGLPSSSDEATDEILNDFEIVLKPDTPDGLILFTGQNVLFQNQNGERQITLYIHRVFNTYSGEGFLQLGDKMS